MYFMQDKITCVIVYCHCNEFDIVFREPTQTSFMQDKITCVIAYCHCNEFNIVFREPTHVLYAR